MVLRKQLCWERYFCCKGKTSVVDEPMGGVIQNLGEILSILTKETKGLLLTCIGGDP
jgi:hypothetical protein